MILLCTTTLSSTASRNDSYTPSRISGAVNGILERWESSKLLFRQRKTACVRYTLAQKLRDTGGLLSGIQDLTLLDLLRGIAAGATDSSKRPSRQSWRV